ncbi:MAG: hypothetical protein JSW27_04515 [Phycisphaerales bacterium]|nr:MAG: hypothetical protein JSW27_04515 [Phycisphaerales bacterium]
MSERQRRVPSGDDVSADEWFVRYLLDAASLVLLMLAAIGVSWYLDGGQYFRDVSREPGAAFLTCMVLCPILGIVTLGFVIYGGIRLFLRPRSVEHALVRLTLFVAYAFVFLVSADTVSTTGSALAGRFGELAADTDESWNVVQGRDFSGSQYDVREGSPEDAPSFPSQFGPGPMGPPTPGRGTNPP